MDLDEDQAADVRVGRALELDLPVAGPSAVFAPDGEFLALYEPADDAGPPGRGVRRLTGRHAAE